MDRKELPVYALVVTRDGPKLRSPKPGEPHRLYTQAPGQLACFSSSMDEFAAELSEVGISRLVLNETKLLGSYDFSLKWTPQENPDAGESLASTSGPSIFTALQEQLGLKLQPAKAPVEVLVIDRVERPSEN